MFNQIVQDALENKSGGEEVLEEYQKTTTLKHCTRHQLVNNQKTNISPTEAVDRLVHFHKVKLTILLQSHCESLIIILIINPKMQWFSIMVLGTHPHILSL